MKQPFYQGENFKKWTLFSFLVLSLGFNLSWNPQLVNIARHEAQVFELAQTAPAAALTVAAGLAKEASTKTAETVEKEEIVDLSKIDPRIQMRLKIFRANDNIYTQAERKTSESEGTTVDCDKCRLQQLKDSAGVNFKEIGDIKLIALKYLEKNQADLLAQTEKDKKSTHTKERGEKVGKVDPKAKGKDQFVESCREESDDDIMTCQFNAIKDKTESCSKYDTVCDKQVKNLWKPIRQYLKKCLATKVSTKNIEFDDSDCDGAEDLAIESLEELRNRGLQSEVLRMLGSNVVIKTQGDQSKLRRQNLNPLVAANVMAQKMDENVSSVSAQIWKAMMANDSYTKSTADRYAAMYEANFSSPLSTERQNMIKDPLNYNFSNLDLGSGSRGGLTAAEITQLRTRAAGASAVPAIPQMVDQTGRTSVVSPALRK